MNPKSSLNEDQRPLIVVNGMMESKAGGEGGGGNWKFIFGGRVTFRWPIIRQQWFHN